MANLDNLIDELSKLTLMEASELVTQLEDKWGVKAASGGGMMMMAGAAGGGAEAAEEQTEFDVELLGAGDKKIQVIKVVREITGLGLKDAKGLVDGAPKVIKEAVTKDEAEAFKNKLEEQGASVAIK